VYEVFKLIGLHRGMRPPLVVFPVRTRLPDPGPLQEIEVSHTLRCENRPANRAAGRETGLEMPCCPVISC
jgi:hypothetical protein